MPESPPRRRIPVFTSVSIFLRALWNDRGHFLGLVRWDFKEAYLGTYIGLAWSFLKPLLYLAALSSGLKYGLGMKSPVEGIGLNTWLIGGLLPWMYISESLSTPIHSIVEHSYLVKKMKFNVSLIPLTKVVTALIIHVILVILFIAYLVANGKAPTWHWIQLPYLMACSTLLLAAIGLLTSSIYVFTRDIGQILSLVTTLAIWLTPVFWPAEMLEVTARRLLTLNPFTYIVEGYRDALLHAKWVFDEPGLTLGFWIVTSLAMVSSMLVFRRLNNHFADVI